MSLLDVLGIDRDGFGGQAARPEADLSLQPDGGRLTVPTNRVEGDLDRDQQVIDVRELGSISFDDQAMALRSVVLPDSSPFVRAQEPNQH